MRRLLASAILLVASLAIPLAQQQAPKQQDKPQQEKPQPAEQARPGRGGRQGAQGQQGQGRGNAAAAKPLVPVVASTVANHPDAYVGQRVSMTAAVDQLFTKTSFSVDQDRTKTSEKDVLVIAPTMTGTLDANAYVTILGEVVKFNPDEVTKKTKNYTLDLTPEQITKYTGKPALIATAVVVDATGVDVAKVVPPPMTAEELEFQKIMKQVGPANTALRTAVDKMDGNAVKEQTAILTKAFTQAEAFWKAKGKADATGWATAAKKDTDTIATAAAAGNWQSAKDSTGPLGQNCTSCHGAYRTRLEDGTFRIKLNTGR